MKEPTAKKRNGLGLVVAGLLLGPTSTMLWLGKGKWAAFYLLLAIAILLLFFGLPFIGFPNSALGLGGFELLEVISLLTSIVGIFHAFKLNQTGPARPYFSNWYIALLLPILIPLVCAAIVRVFLFQPFNIPSASSAPNYMVGDYVFVSKTAYSNGKSLQIGDTAIFKNPRQPQYDYIKRIVGGPGDRIQMIKGVLNINGAPVKLETIQLPDFLRGDDGPKAFYRETLPNGRSYVVADMGQTSADDTELYVVPEGHYFVMGDNRDNSQDSRDLDALGYIPRENFLGPIMFRFMNNKGLPLLGRPQEQ